MNEANETGTSEPDDLLGIFVGPTHAHYFADAFGGFATGGSVKWNWPTFFATLPWLLYRKMWLYSFGYAFGVPIVLIAIWSAVVLMVDREAGFLSFYLLYLVIGFVLAPMFVTRLYYGHARKKVGNIQARTHAGEEQRLEIARAGSTTIIGIIVSVLVMIIPLVGIVAGISIPAYHDMGIRGQMSEGLALSGEAKAAVAEYFVDNNQYPPDNVAAGLPPAAEISGRYVSSVQVEVGIIIVTFGEDADRKIRGRTLILQPENSDDGVSWACFSPEIRRNLLPAACR